MLFTMMLREDARPEVVQDNMGHANIDVIPNIYGKSWEKPLVTRTSIAVTTEASRIAFIVVMDSSL